MWVGAVAFLEGVPDGDDCAAEGGLNLGVRCIGVALESATCQLGLSTCSADLGICRGVDDGDVVAEWRRQRWRGWVGVGGI